LRAFYLPRSGSALALAMGTTIR